MFSDDVPEDSEDGICQETLKALLVFIHNGTINSGELREVVVQSE